MPQTNFRAHLNFSNFHCRVVWARSPQTSFAPARIRREQRDHKGGSYQRWRARGNGAPTLAATATPVLQYAVTNIYPAKLKLVQSKRDQDDKRIDDVPRGQQFVRLDAYRQRCTRHGVDVVAVAPPSGFRPTHFKAQWKLANMRSWKTRGDRYDGAFGRCGPSPTRKGTGRAVGFCWRANYAQRAFSSARLDEVAIGVALIIAPTATGP